MDNSGYPSPISSVDELPKNYEGLKRERFWQRYWMDSGIYKFEPRRADGTLRTRDEIFSVDTPPPTVSGALHIGHVYSYTQTDMSVRYRRMTGKHVFYPFGFDDNGLPTERLVEKEKGVRAHEVSREEFIAMCKEVVEPAERQFIDLWQSLALSCDWEQFYTTIDARSRAISQASFIDLYNKGYIYRKVAPTQWDWVNQTAIAQAEIEDREVPGHFHFIKFQWADGPGAPAAGEFVIGTTRPELIPACVAVMVNPDSDQLVRDHEGNAVRDNDGNEVRQVDLIGKVAITPLFEVEVPILPSEKADPEKGTGILMCCTFGDQEDVEHWQQFNLPTRVIIGKDGRMINELGWFDASRDAAATETFYGQLAGQKVKQARETIREKVSESGAMIGLKEIMHTVRHAERGDVPVEILVTPQWYVNLLEHKEALVEQGRKVNWHPEYMRKRYEQWVEGLNGDWCISRQRYNGVPFPVWYNAKGEPMLADIEQLPVNPLSDQPRQADKMSALHADPDVMDTWATSSVTPLLNTHLMPGMQYGARASSPPGAGEQDARAPEMERHNQLFPYDMRPQAHDIIRTWAFYTIAKAYFHFGTIPWSDIVISGHAQDAGKQKMSKSKGNVVTPAEMVEKYTADGLRYWSGGAKLGTDTIYDETKLGEGRKLINKIFNATKFALRHLLDFDPVGAGFMPGPAMQPETDGPSKNSAPTAITYPTDLWLIGKLNVAIERATKANEEYEFGDARQAAEDFFWADLCDNYLEFSKGRLYGEPLAVDAHDTDATELRRSAQATLYIALSSVLKMFAPILPHITEECWSWYFAQHSDKRSIHEESWPTRVGEPLMAPKNDQERAEPSLRPKAGTDGTAPILDESGINAAPTGPGEFLVHAVTSVRKWKSERGVSIKTPLAQVSFYRTGESGYSAADLQAVLGDLLSTCNAQAAELLDSAPPEGAVTTERNPLTVVCMLTEQQ